MSEVAVAIERALEERAGISAIVEERGNRIVLNGPVQSEEERRAAREIAAELAPRREIVDELEIVSVLPASLGDFALSEAAIGGLRGADGGTSDLEALEPGDFTDQRILNNAAGAAGPGDTTADEDISEGEEVYIPPTDPPSDGGDIVLGGFATTSMNSIEVERSSDGMAGDEALADAVRRALRVDASTDGLEIQVTVTRGVAHLRGQVRDILDAENAEEVAARVPGILEVIEELDVAEI